MQRNLVLIFAFLVSLILTQSYPLNWVHSQDFSNPQALNLESHLIRPKINKLFFKLPAQDAEGWSTFFPSADSLIIYISRSEGNDQTGIAYSSDSLAMGNDPFNPQRKIKAFATLEKAKSLVRKGHPDWILFKRGDVWTEMQLPQMSGRSPTERFIYGAYGQGARPLFIVSKKSPLQWNKAKFIAITSLYFWAQARDPDSGQFVNYSGTSGMRMSANTANALQDILIEDCVFKSYTGNLIQDRQGGMAERIVLRRNLVLDNYNTRGHSQGLFTFNTSIFLDGNIFDRNGWLRQQRGNSNEKLFGQATMFNHSIYLVNSRNSLLQNNLFLRSSSIGVKLTANSGTHSASDILIKNNLFAEGEIGISAGGNQIGKLRFLRMGIEDNLLMNIGRTRPTNRNLGWGIEISDWEGGVISGNLLASWGKNTNNNYCLGLWTKNVLSRNILVANNRAFDMANSNNCFQLTPNSMIENIQLKNNQVLSTNKLLSISLENYQKWLTGQANLAEFIKAIRSQSKTHWKTQYTANKINRYFREKFN